MATLRVAANSTANTGANLAYLDSTPVGAISDIMVEAHGKLVKRDWYRTRRGTLRGVPGDGTVACLQIDNLHMAAMMSGQCNKLHD